jgi:hypothetical protein
MGHRPELRCHNSLLGDQAVGGLRGWGACQPAATEMLVTLRTDAKLPMSGLRDL